MITGRHLSVEIADEAGNRLVRNQSRVSVESLVRASLSEDILCSARQRDGLDPLQSPAVHLLNMLPGPRELTPRSAGSGRSNTP